MSQDVFSKIHYDLAKAQGMLNARQEMKKGLPPGPKKDQPLDERKIKGSSHKPPKEYAEGGAKKASDYADPKNWKYPIDNEKHVRAAISYFGQPDNYGQYSTSERKTMANRIIRAAKKHGIKVSDEWKKKFGIGSKK